MSVTVPGGVDIGGMSGSQTSRSSRRGRWWVIAHGGVAALELSDDTTTVQAGIRPGEGNTIYLAE